MSDGISEANREARLVDDVERTACDLAEALLATGDLMFDRVNPAAIRYANAELRRTGYLLTEQRRR